jgi:hypothetical protein
MKLVTRGPGLAKTRQAPLLGVRTLRLVTSSDARWRELFEKADIISEGASRGEGDSRAYFGCTDIVLLVRPEQPGQSLAYLAGAAAFDPHVRLRAVRMARREAAQRANGPLDRLRAEISVSACARGVTVHVEVEAHVFPDRRAVPRVAGCAPSEI